MARESELLVVSATGGEPAWKQRAVERSTRAAKLRAERKVEQFLDAAQAIIVAKGTTDFTVQEVVDRSGQSLRSFYQHFGGKHELLLALFEDALRRSAEQIRAVAGDEVDPVVALRTAVRLLFESSVPDPSARHPLFTEFAPQLLVSYPAEVRAAHAPLLEVLAEMTVRAEAVGQLRPSLRPRRAAAMVMETVMFLAQSTAIADDEGSHPITADEVWDFCASGFVAG
ncbi:TetR family transcriptional regulator [Frankia sp. AiPs1]|uniref:TetR/AcrR family transcriptional regulator n=1 Tax=Frankia sp. AiPa1 TaxID=573492 RepID=UPI00202B51C0|nr:TetR/AcrR family transcriptional regulator [Frankia sp. AiPa1]MCL9760090.1 TetR/AcrR family transcriptional regulator [Frankia sp. AiPa1]